MKRLWDADVTARLLAVAKCLSQGLVVQGLRFTVHPSSLVGEARVVDGLCLIGLILSGFQVKQRGFFEAPARLQHDLRQA